MNTQPKKTYVFNIAGGIGKNIIASATIHALKIAHQDCDIIVTSPYPDAWRSNPDVARVVSPEHEPHLYKDYIRKADEVFCLEPYSSEDYFYHRMHLSKLWAKLCGIDPDSVGMPILVLTDEEVAATQKKLRGSALGTDVDAPLFILQTSGGALQQPYPVSWARDIPYSIAEDVCIEMKKRGFRVIHLRRPDQRPLTNAEWIPFTMREVFAVIQLSDKRLLIDSVAQHVAAALGKPSVVTWVGNNPTVFGYDLHTNIIPNSEPQYRHAIDSFLEPYNITGALHEYPYNTDRIYSVENIIEALTFTPLPKVIRTS